MPNYRPDKVRVPRIVSECRSEFVDGCVDAVLGFEKAVAAPEPLLNGLSADQPPWILEQQDEQLHRNAFELDGATRQPQFAALDIQFELLKSYGWGGHRSYLAGPAEGESAEEAVPPLIVVLRE
jgi:hypothetical protein